jgi:hypothetical protein
VNLHSLPSAHCYSGTNAIGTHNRNRNATYTPPPRTVLEGNPGIHNRRPISMVNKYLELCVNTGDYEIGLGEIKIRTVDSNIVSDGQLFLRIKETYDEIRKSLKTHRLGLFKPADISFVKVKKDSDRKRRQYSLYSIVLCRRRRRGNMAVFFIFPPI